MEQMGMTQLEFANRIGVSPASLSSIFTGRTNPTNNHVSAVHRAFPDININWLMFGEGDMYVHQEKPADEDSPLFSQDSAASRNFTAQQPQATTDPQRDGETQLAFTPDNDGRSINTAVSSRTKMQVLHGEGAGAQHEFPELKYFDKTTRRIKEIRVFYDDGTYEAFTPSK